MRPDRSTSLCCRRCGCDLAAHLHERDGWDCGTCGRDVCHDFVYDPWWLAPGWHGTIAALLVVAAVIGVALWLA